MVSGRTLGATHLIPVAEFLGGRLGSTAAALGALSGPKFAQMQS